MKLGNVILIVALAISSLSILVSGKPSSRRLKNQRNNNKEAEEVDVAKNDAASAASVTPSTGSQSSSNVSDTSLDSVLTLPTVKSKKLKKSHRLKHRRFGHHHKKHNRRSHNHRGGNRRHHNSTKHEDPTTGTAGNVTSLELPSTLTNREQADIPSLKLLRNSHSGHRKFKRHHHHRLTQNKRSSKKVKEQLAGEKNEGE